MNVGPGGVQKHVLFYILHLQHKLCIVGFEVITLITMKSTVFCVVTPYKKSAWGILVPRIIIEIVNMCLWIWLTAAFLIHPSKYVLL
jgi:hypothetical protein